MVRGKQKKAEWPCGTCQKDCRIDCLLCDTCNKWHHIQCQDISPSELQRYSAIEESYICQLCRSDDGQYDFLFGLARLTKAAKDSYEKLQSVATREKMLVKGSPLRVLGPHISTASLKLDPISQSLLCKYAFELSDKAAQSTPDGDCLFNAVSVLLQGNETLSVELRYRTCIEMVENRDAILSNKNSASFSLLSPDYSESTRNCAKYGNSFSSVWTIIALTNVINTPIKTIYPAVNGVKDLAFKKFNTVFFPRERDDTKEQMKVMWSSVHPPELGKLWIPNHFVPVVPAMVVQDPHQTWVKTDGEVNESIMVSDDSSTLEQCSFTTEELKGSSTPESNELKQRKPLTESSDDLSFVLPKKRRTSGGNSFDCTLESRNRFEILSDDDNDTCMPPDSDNLDTQSDVPEPGLKKAHNDGKFMSHESVFQVFLTTEQPLECIPNGTKTNVYVVLNNARNKEKKKSEFPDDRGIWCSEKGTTANQSYEITDSNGLITLYKRNGIFCRRKYKQGKPVFEPCVPQPERYLTFHRYYTTLKGDSNYKRRITVITESPQDFSNLKNMALIEYSGEKTENPISHGNSKTKTPYVRTDPKILADCALQAKHIPASQVCYDAAKNNSVLGPKSSRQISDKMYREKKKTQAPSQNNIADEILSILGKQSSDDYIKKIEFGQGKLPNIILYTKQQITDLISNCTGEGGSVIGIDRTFNLGKCFVTAMSYKNQRVLNRKTNEYPIILGPVFLHWDAEMATYHSFFAHIRAKLGNAILTIGSDEERAMTNALHDCFHNGNFLLCTKHIKDNLNRFLEKSGTPLSDRKQICKIIFADDGLVFSTDDFEYLARLDDLEQFFESNLKFKHYWEKYLEIKLKNYVMAPLREKIITSLWTNNNSESINNRLKQVADFKQHKLPDLVQKLSLVSKMQMLDLRRALHGTGNFRLTAEFSKFEIDQDTWNTRTQQEKDQHFENLLRTKKPKRTAENDKYIKATGIHFFCTKPKSSCGKKPGQRKRHKSERTRTFKKLKFSS